MRKDSLEYLESLPYNFEDRKNKVDYFNRVCGLVPDTTQPWMECGVGTGKTAKLLIERKGNRWLHLFDSFDGIPDSWALSQDQVYEPGFGKHELPKKEITGVGVALYVGKFEDTIPFWAHDNKYQIGLVHIDCDVYSSTVDVLHALNLNIRQGTIIMFDEYFNYQRFAEHEYKAFSEFVRGYNFEFEYIARSEVQAAVRIL